MHILDFISCWLLGLHNVRWNIMATYTPVQDRIMFIRHRHKYKHDSQTQHLCTKVLFVEESWVHIDIYNSSGDSEIQCHGPVWKPIPCPHHVISGPTICNQNPTNINICSTGPGSINVILCHLVLRHCDWHSVQINISRTWSTSTRVLVRRCQSSGVTPRDLQPSKCACLNAAAKPWFSSVPSVVQMRA